MLDTDPGCEGCVTAHVKGSQVDASRPLGVLKGVVYKNFHENFCMNFFLVRGLFGKVRSSGV